MSNFIIERLEQLNDKPHVAFDIETLALGNPSPIIELGAVEFDPFINADVKRMKKGSFSTGIIITPDECDFIDLNTFKWWMGYDRVQHFYECTTPGNGYAVNPTQAIIGLHDWLPNDGDVYLWTNSPKFDAEIYEGFLSRHAPDIDPPWHWSSHLDYRSFQKFFGDNREYDADPSLGDYHHAKFDAFIMARAIQNTVSEIYRLRATLDPDEVRMRDVKKLVITDIDEKSDPVVE